ncbi:uncharacterized protein EV154DRAFT_517971, partial [Mucor mucedo]|uniref:uncharacterized protein n=1 Tax=Mucor mucedo TaxID=29922 RepID=UPI00221FCD8D
LRDEELFFFYEDGQNNIYNENGQLRYVSMEDVMSTIDDPNIVLETLVNHSSYMKNKPLEKQPTENKKSTTSKPVKFASKRNNVDYSINQRTTFIDRMIELPMGQRYAAVVGRELGVKKRTAQRWWRSYKEIGEVPVVKT